MSHGNTLPAFEILLADKNINSILEALIKDQAFSIEFLASCVANYYVTVLRKEKK